VCEAPAIKWPPNTREAPGPFMPRVPAGRFPYLPFADSPIKSFKKIRSFRERNLDFVLSVKVRTKKRRLQTNIKNENTN
jgi:hypothetical protein